MTNIVFKSNIEHVKGQYNDYPYPPRAPEDEKRRLLKIYGEYLGEINHWLFDGKKDFTKGFRCLVAGGGTGDAAIYLAEQLRHTNAEIIYLDFSKSTMLVAQNRAKMRKLTNIRWVHDSIINLPQLSLGKFDYINCCGVLHHMTSPEAGLQILSTMLNDTGGLGVMVYAKYGRTGVYQIQEAMRLVNQNASSMKEEVQNAWEVINSLPSTNWYSRGKELLADHMIHGDIGLYDMFLHKQDRAYSIPELYNFIESANLNFVNFSSAHSRFMLKVDNYIKDAALKKKIKKLSIMQQQAIAEIMCGSIVKHSFYASKKQNTVAKWTDLENVPNFYLVTNVPEKISTFLQSANGALPKAVKFSWKSDTLGDTDMTVPVSQYTESLFRNMIGGKKSLHEIFKSIERDLGKKIKKEILLDEINKIFPAFQESGLLILHNKKVSMDPFV